MNIIWNPNPLATVIELDDFDQKLLWHRLKIEYLEERMFQVHFTLSPSTREWHNKHVSERSLEASVDAALKELDIDYIHGDEKYQDQTFSQYLDQQLKEYVEELSGVHCGNCTCVACSCLKCHAESLIGVNTTQGLGKHEASYIDGAFTPKVKGGPIPTLDQAIESLRDYRFVKGSGWEKFSEEEFQQHVPRWSQEAKRAHDWLVAYKEAHFK